MQRMHGMCWTLLALPAAFLRARSSRWRPGRAAGVRAHQLRAARRPLILLTLLDAGQATAIGSGCTRVGSIGPVLDGMRSAAAGARLDPCPVLDGLRAAVGGGRGGQEDATRWPGGGRRSSSHGSSSHAAALAPSGGAVSCPLAGMPVRLDTPQFAVSLPLRAPSRTWPEQVGQRPQHDERQEGPKERGGITPHPNRHPDR